MKSAIHADIDVISFTSYETDGTPSTQVVPIGATTDAGSSVKAEAYHPYGFIGRPADAITVPQSDASNPIVNGARVLFFYEGSTLHSVALDDPRITPNLPQVPKGGSCHYGGTGMALGTATFDATGGWTCTPAQGQKANLGGAGAASLAFGDALQELITGLQAFTTATKGAVIEPTLGPASTALDLIVQAITQIKTLIAEGA